MSRVLDEVRSRMSGVTRPGLVAVSGGPDSVALLRAMKEVCPVPFTVVHVNHALRGEESDGDEAFVVDLAARLGVPIRMMALPIPDGESIEVTARNLRYSWFRDVAKELDCGWLATGHTADDQAETVLHRIIRGTGLQGLSGMQSPGTVVPGLSLFRPFLKICKNELLEFLSLLRQPFRTDSSNANPQFTRNRIRHELLPLLHSFNPQVVDALTRLADQAGESKSVIDERIQILTREVVLPAAGDTLILDADRLAASNAYLVRAFFVHLYQSHGWPAGEMTAEHWHRLAALTPGDYPGGVSMIRASRVVQLRRKKYKNRFNAETAENAEGESL